MDVFFNQYSRNRYDNLIDDTRVHKTDYTQYKSMSTGDPNQT